MARVRLAVALLLSLGCRGEPAPSTPIAAPARHDAELDRAQAQWLAELARAADEHPDDKVARKRSGLAHMRWCLSGVLSLRDRAERDLEAAFALDPADRDVTRALGRFYNLRAVAGDSSKAERQVEVYRAHLGDTPVEQMSANEFVAWSFSQLGEILAARNRGRLLEALRIIDALEQRLAERVAAAPDDIEMRALAGNFAFFFAGNVPLQRRRRVEQAVAHFEVLRARWDEVRAGARDGRHCPNTRENFMFELAEGYLVLEQTERAAEIYRELGDLRPPVTRAKERIAQVAAERLGGLDHYAGRMELMPPWPSDVGNCVVCHAYTSDVPLTSLYVRAPLGELPSTAVRKPIDPR
jgi:tetratricopeptide (TPR) repeat protein